MTDGMTFSEYVKAKELIKKLGEAYNAYYDTSRGMPYDIDTTIRESAMCIENCLNEIHRLIADNQELKTASKGIAEVLHIVTQDDVTYRFLLNDAVERERVKQEAYKEFAERLKKGVENYDEYEVFYSLISAEEVDNLLKEMIGE